MSRSQLNRSSPSVSANELEKLSSALPTPGPQLNSDLASGDGGGGGALSLGGFRVAFGWVDWPQNRRKYGCHVAPLIEFINLSVGAVAGGRCWCLPKAVGHN